jgi:hypothetical protein
MESVKIQLSLEVKHRYITGLDDFLNIIKICMEFVERFPSIRSEQKKLIVVETVGSRTIGSLARYNIYIYNNII